jgi:hypothetical protein
MSKHQPGAVVIDSPTNPPDLHGNETARDDSITPPEEQASARDIVRLFQCRVCSLPLQEPVTLPCGRSICRRCLPESYARPNITYPAGPERLQGFQCPFADCGKEHAIGDCGLDVILSKATQHAKDGMSRSKASALGSGVTTTVIPEDAWAVAGVPSMNEGTAHSDAQTGGALVALWLLAEQGALQYEVEVTYSQQGPALGGHFADSELKVLHEIQDSARTEMDCQICYSLFYDPLTTSCGHTFCRSCLRRILDHSRICPVCRRKLALNPLLNRVACPSNERLSGIIKTFWINELSVRKETLEAEQHGRHQDFDIPLFVCTLSFPMMPTFLHIFEPRYRLMIRRAVAGDRLFGMVLPKRPRHAGDANFHELGTLLRIINVQYYPDGRSLIETMGISRFRTLEHGTMDGYAMGKITRIDDISLEEEEAVEAREVSRLTSVSGDGAAVDGPDSPSSDNDRSRVPQTVDDVETMSTQALMEYARDFVTRMRAQSVPWLTERMLAIYGECPNDPAILPWWLASTLPIRDLEKYRLLGTSSVRDRLKICCKWIVEWNTGSW